MRRIREEVESCSEHLKFKKTKETQIGTSRKKTQRDSNKNRRFRDQANSFVCVVTKNPHHRRKNKKCGTTKVTSIMPRRK
jgi:hypothetical protein